MKVPSVRIPVVRRGKSDELPGVVAPARLDRRTKNLTKRLCPGDIAIIDHTDLDRVAADALISRKVVRRGERGGQHERALPEPRARSC